MFSQIVLSQVVWDWLARLGENPFLDLLLIGTFVVIGVAVIAVQWRRLRVAQLEADLKKQMLERGMGAEDIEKVLRTTAAPPPEPQEESFDAATAFTGNATTDVPRLVKVLLDNGYSGDNVQRLLRLLDCAAQPESKDGFDARLKQKAATIANMAENALEVDDMEKILNAVEPRPVR